jgi:hypothetical protein
MEVIMSNKCSFFNKATEARLDEAEAAMWAEISEFWETIWCAPDADAREDWYWYRGSFDGKGDWVRDDTWKRRGPFPSNRAALDDAAQFYLHWRHRLRAAQISPTAATDAEPTRPGQSEQA